MHAAHELTMLDTWFYPYSHSSRCVFGFGNGKNTTPLESRQSLGVPSVRFTAVLGEGPAKGQLSRSTKGRFGWICWCICHFDMTANLDNQITPWFGSFSWTQSFSVWGLQRRHSWIKRMKQH